MDLNGETYDPNEDLIACIHCSDLYEKNFKRVKIRMVERAVFGFYHIIKGAKNDDDDDIVNKSLFEWEVKAKKALGDKIRKGESWNVERSGANCKKCENSAWWQEKLRNNTFTYEEQQKLVIKRTNNYGDELIIDHTCPTEEDRGKDNQEEIRKYGSEYKQLTLHQKEGRQTTYNNWEQKRQKNYGRLKVCRYCPQTFKWDNDLEFLPSKKKVENELKVHENTCPKKNDRANQKKLKQAAWEERRKKKGSSFYDCKHCWGKVCLDKKISDWEKAKKQALADLAYHEKKECAAVDGTGKALTMIPICFSPNKGGNKHADLTFADGINEDDLAIEQDNETEVIYEEQQDNSKKPTNYTPWIIGGVAIVIGVIILFWMRKRKKSK